MLEAFDLDVDVVELAPCPPPSRPAPLQEMAFRSDAWLPAELAQLQAMFAADASFEEIGRALGRGAAGVADKAWSLGLRRRSARPWSDLEDELLLKRYGTEPAAVLALELGRSCSSVYVRAAVLGLTEDQPPPYTAWEDAQVRAGYAKGVPALQIGLLIGRTEASVRTRACSIGVRSIFAVDGWTDAALDRLLDLANEGHRYLAIIELLVAEGFPRRTKAGLGPKLRQLGYRRGWGRRWTSDEDELLRHCYATGASLTPLREGLGRTVYSIRHRVKELGLQGTHANHDGFRQGPVWSEEDDRTLRELYGKVPTKDLAGRFGRPKGGVLQRAWHLGLTHGYWRPYTPDELRAMSLAQEHGIAIADLAIALDRHAATVSKYLTKQGINFGRRPRRKSPFSLAEILALEPPAPTPPPRGGGIGKPMALRRPRQFVAPASRSARAGDRAPRPATRPEAC